jgi:hypothetical protein
MAGKRARQNKAPDKRSTLPQDRPSAREHPSPASVFGVTPPLVDAVGRDTDAESPPVQLIAWALLALVLAAGALLVLTARLSQLEGFAAIPQPAPWLQRILQVAQFAPRGVRRRPAAQ